MTTPSQITSCAAHARTSDLIRDAAAARLVPRGPRSTFRPSSWFGRRRGPAPRPHAVPGHP
jgi:hypothetical protein